MSRRAPSPVSLAPSSSGFRRTIPTATAISLSTTPVPTPKVTRAALSEPTTPTRDRTPGCGTTTATTPSAWRLLTRARARGSWDVGAENYTQDQAQTSSFGDTSTSTRPPSTALRPTRAPTHTGGGTDTLSSGDQVGHNYGDITIDPTTGDVDSDTGWDNYTLSKVLRRHLHQFLQRPGDHPHR